MMTDVFLGEICVRKFSYWWDFLLFVLSEEFIINILHPNHVYHACLPRLIVPKTALRNVCVMLGHIQFNYMIYQCYIRYESQLSPKGEKPKLCHANICGKKGGLETAVNELKYYFGFFKLHRPCVQFQQLKFFLPEYTHMFTQYISANVSIPSPDHFLSL